ncbi:hypothetical protein LCGC14_0057870 [marine sediment metagenome]|uniref:YjiS-like domain-containing protein n=1 Tax=marine sediment metagenome TaxID=412755 RepID=A0A0F9YR39_9ZZZZ|nr:DUF1127 domain-containing protein [Halomonas sp.]HDZ47488.1 DUF1127 domain-containing protein [Halomonas sp.]HEB05289.1 DUF1127 domain-containing protein [Halomonas sp.]
MPRFSLTQFRYQLSCQLHQYRHYRRSRRQLLTLDDRLLEDIGINRTQALKEGHKAFWKRTTFKRGPYENR